MEENIKRKLNEVEDYIDSADWELKSAQDELYKIYDLIEENSKSNIKDIDNFKRELKRDGLYNQKLEDFIEQYMKYYNK